MCSIPPLRHYKTRKHYTATSRGSATVVLAAAFGVVFLANGAFAQVQESTPSILSSGARGSTAGQISPSQWSATQLPPASQPPIESIGPGSDIRPFLQPGVPQELTRAALRRAWVTDPAIRNFIGLSENSRDDLNSPSGASRLGSLTALTDEVQAGSSAQVK